MISIGSYVMTWIVNFSYLFLMALLFHSNDKPLETINTPFISHGEGPTFYVDYTNLKGMGNKTFVEFYFQVNYDELQFIKDKKSKKFKAGYDLDFRAYDKEDHLAQSHHTVDEIIVDSYKETKVTNKARVSLAGFSFTPGQYRIKIFVTDHETEKISVINKIIQIRSFQSSDLMISDIQFSQKIKPSEEGLPYVKNGRYIEPNVLKAYSHDSNGIYIYFEIYNLKIINDTPHSTYTAIFKFFNQKGEKIAQFRRRKMKPGPIAAHSLKLPVDYFSSGKFTLQLEVRDDVTGQVAKTAKDFSIIDRPITLSEID